MRKIKPSDCDYSKIVHRFAQIVNIGNEFPGNVFKDNDLIYIYGFIDLITGVEMQNNFHKLLSDFIKSKNQSHYYIIPLWNNMNLMEHLPIMEFNVDDSANLYREFLYKCRLMPAIENFITVPDAQFIFNENLDWFIHFDNRWLDLGLFAVKKQNDLTNFTSSFSEIRNDFCSEDELLMQMEGAFSKSGEENFNKWIKPHLIYLKENEEED